MSNLLAQATELPITMYSSLSNPIFKGQTSLDDDCNYWVVVECEGKLYKFHLSF
jgi:hypothetical protein